MNWAVAVASGLASGVEFVEAFTIVLAVAVARGWRSSINGALLGVVALAAICAIFGIALIHLIPLAVLRTVVGVLLLLFGLKWLRKAILRAGGVIKLHDEASIFEREVAELRKGATDWEGLLTSFNGVLLEGLEVVFIVISLGASTRLFGSAIAGAAIALGLVLIAGVALKTPLQRVPENNMKFVVGLMLTTFGTLWAGEGLGVAWWHQDASAIWLLVGFILVSWGAVAMVRARTSAPSGHAAATAAGGSH
ncbi:MAG TPA: hypothetical protein VNM16_08915 [Bacillota bacterium]|nr:hypothetical protein [Bacillota bacterium]